MLSRHPQQALALLAPLPSLGLASALVLVAGLVPSLARADSLESTHGGALKESAHQVQVQRDGQDLRLRVRRTIRNLGERGEEADLRLDLPPGAVATGLRTKIDRTWFPGQLMDAETSSEMYAHLTETGPVGTRGPALLSFESEGQLRLKVFPILAGTASSVEYDLRVPTCYRDGMRLALYFDPLEEQSAPDELLAPARIRLASGLRGKVYGRGAKLPGAVHEARESCLGTAEWLSESYAEEHALIVVHEDPEEQIRARIGTHVLGAQRTLAELSIELSPELSEKPAGAEIVFVLDASYSQGEASLRAQLDLVANYLEHLPDARFEVVVYRRRAQRLLGSLQSARTVKQTIAGLKQRLPELGNGSNLDAGVTLAAQLLPDASTRPQRIIAVTDSLVREDLKASALQRSLAAAPRALLHLIDLQEGSGAYHFEREDEHALALAASATGGMFVRLQGQREGRGIATGLLGLVRPIQLDEVVLRGSTDWVDIEETAEEGYGYRSMVMISEMPEELALTAKLWGREIRVEAKSDSGISARVPALVMGRSLMDELAPDEVANAARAAQVVSPATSFLARDLEAGPSSYGHQETIHGLGLRGFGTSSSCGGCSGYLVGHGGVSPREEGNYSAALAGLLGDAVGVCAILHDGDASSLNLGIETTGSEIVEVVSADAGEFGACAREAAWALRLGAFFARSSGAYAVDF